MKAKTPKQILMGMKSLYDNGMKHCRWTCYANKQGRILRDAKKEFPTAACMIGTFYLIEADESVRLETKDLIEQKLILSHRRKDGQMSFWNDDSTRTKQDVVAFLQEVIQSLP